VAKKDPWEGVEPERREMAESVFAAAKQLAEEDGDGEFALEGRSPALRAVGSSFHHLVSRAAKGELDENDPSDVADALKLVSATMVDQRQPEQFRGFAWMNGGKPLVPLAASSEQPFGPQETPYITGRTPEGAPVYGNEQPSDWITEVQKDPGLSAEMQRYYDQVIKRKMQGPARPPPPASPFGFAPSPDEPVGNF
jgi:hypothetical protein